MEKFCRHDECAEQADFMYEKKDACYHKVKARYDVWPSAYASGWGVRCTRNPSSYLGKKKK